MTVDLKDSNTNRFLLKVMMRNRFDDLWSEDVDDQV